MWKGMRKTDMKNTKRRPRGWGWSSVVDSLPSTCEALCSSPSTRGIGEGQGQKNNKYFITFDNYSVKPNQVKDTSIAPFLQKKKNIRYFHT